MARISRKFKDVSLSFVRNPVTNDILAITDADAIKRSVINLVRTRIGEKFYNRLIGTKVEESLFEIQSPEIAYKLQLEIESLLKNYERRIKLSSVIVSYEDGTNDLDVTITYDIIGLPVATQTIEFVLQSTRI